MSKDSRAARAALERLVGALEAHLEAAEQRRSERDPGVEAAYRNLADAFETYDEALYSTHDEVTPFVLYDDVEDEREDAELDDLDDLEESDLDEDDSDDVVDDIEDLTDDSDDDGSDDDDSDDGDDFDDGSGFSNDYAFEPRATPDTSSRA